MRIRSRYYGDKTLWTPTVPLNPPQTTGFWTGVVDRVNALVHKLPFRHVSPTHNGCRSVTQFEAGWGLKAHHHLYSISNLCTRRNHGSTKQPVVQPLATTRGVAPCPIRVCANSSRLLSDQPRIMRYSLHDPCFVSLVCVALFAKTRPKDVMTKSCV